jgi:hypothetical protein
VLKNTLIQFTLLIPVNHRLREVNFRKRSAERYDCNMADERGERHYFHLIKQDDNWQIPEGTLPAWLSGNEPAIVRVLVEKENQDMISTRQNK